MENKAVECQRNGKELYKRLLNDMRMQNAELIREANDAQTERFIAEFKVSEQKNAMRYDFIRSKMEEERRKEREDFREVRKLGWWMGAFLTIISIILSVVYLFCDMPSVIIEFLSFGIAIFGCGLGWVLCDICRRLFYD